MEELVARITRATGLDDATARKAVGIILLYLKKEGPAEDVNRLLSAMPGADEVIKQAEGGQGSLVGSVMGMGGGVMALGGQLMGAGVPMSAMQPLGRELFAFGREKAGEDAMGAIVGSIPGISQFV
jgi:hypothetical protein